MLRDFKFSRRNSARNEEIENVPVNPRDSLGSQASYDSLNRAPFNTIQEPTPNPKPELESSFRSRIDRTPTKPKHRNPDSTLPLRTPEKHGGLSKQRFGWAQRNDNSDDVRIDARNGGLVNMTPRVSRGVGRANSCYSESNSTQSTPTKSVSKPPTTGYKSKIDGNGGMRVGNFAALYRGMPSSCSPATVVNTVEVPHFDLKEDPSFWMDHNVQVLIRVRPLNSMEKSMHGYNRCLRQESAQSITWIGQPETRFTFDHVACETVDQEILFRMAGLPMVENCLSGYNSCMFAYGQTGSGKTYTMLGEIDDLEVKPSPHRGMTPRIFEFLFARIQAEEEIRRDEKLKYNCKCSFLEIYNEQITDLLDPSSNNLLLREDIKKGVYVENLSEFEVQTVNDILKLLAQGSLNRKVAATHMNRESSRSHSVFTCVIESRWEKDSTTNLRFARLNLVDLAGSERQKTSGAEGERLKEAANINKSLSTLGHVIMILVDVAHGKPRHVPYRDSKLTFLLQDSLGGNSKTMIIANVSPSICCAAETLNTLKFAQRAKLIQNNAVVNEDSTGDVIALQHQIRLLKEELSALKRQNVSRSLSFCSTDVNAAHVQEVASNDNKYEMDQGQVDDVLGYESKGTVRMSTKQLKCLETTLAGALRREQMAETSIKILEAEIEKLNCLVRQREEDTRSTKMMLRFREDKIQRMESLARGSLPVDSFLMEENRVLSEEVQLLQAKVDKNPEVIRFALENIRLLDQLRRYQEFYEEGEREILLDEVSALRDQVLHLLDANSKQHGHANMSMQSQACMSKEKDTLHFELQNTYNELEECRHNLNSCLEDNAKLHREINDLRTMLNDLNSAYNDQDYSSKTIKDSSKNEDLEKIDVHQDMKNAEQIMDLQLELDILKIILQEERSSYCRVEERAKCMTRDLELAEEKLLVMSKQFEDINNELREAKTVIEALESQQILSINEMKDLKKSNSHYVKLLREQQHENIALKKQLARKEVRDLSPSECSESQESRLQLKFKRLQDSLDKAKRMNEWYQDDRAFQATNADEMDAIRRQAEAETVEVIVSMQEELAALQQQVEACHLREMEAKMGTTILETELKELQKKVHLLSEDNRKLHERVEEKDVELRVLTEEWVTLASEIENILNDGQEELIDATDQLELISSCFSQKRIWISDQVSRLIGIISEKESLIEELGRCLEDANEKRSNLECMLKSLRGAALVINEAHQLECNEKEKEILLLKSQLSVKTSAIVKLEDRMQIAEDDIKKASVCATVAFIIVNRLSETNLGRLNALEVKDAQLRESADIILRKDALLKDQAAAIEVAEKQIYSLRGELAEYEESYAELGQRLLQEEQRASIMNQRLKDIEENGILETEEKLNELKTGLSTLRSCMSKYAQKDGSSKRNTMGICSPVDGNDEKQSNDESNQDDMDLDSDQELRTDNSKCSSEVGKSLGGYSGSQTSVESGKSLKNVFDRDVTVILLKKEIESALQSLNEVQTEMAKLYHEKEEIWMSNRRDVESMEHIRTQVLALQAAMSNFEHQLGLKMEAVNDKLKSFEQTVQESETYWCQTKEFLELEIGEARTIAVQRGAESSCILAKFEEAQDTMKEADILINGLMISNEKMKLEIERLKGMACTLENERDALTDQVQNLQSMNTLKDQQLENLEQQFASNLTETRDLVAELEGFLGQVQIAFNEKLMTIASDCHCIKSLLLDSTKLVQSRLEDVWSDIIVKDCALSVLHLCHIGILLETVTGLNVENGFLQHGLSESNAVIADLREHNLKSRKELQICRALKGKLLTDIKNSFDRISRKEEETGELSIKLITFDKKISDLQLQEEVMLQRSNDIGSQLAILMKELNLSKENFVASLLDQEKLLKEKEELLQSQTEISVIDLCSKDIESLILTSELGEMAVCLADTKMELISADTILDNLKRETIFSKVDAVLKEQLLLDREVEIAFLQEKNEEAASEIRKLKTENSLFLHDLEEKKSELESCLNCISTSNKETEKLQDKVLSLEICVNSLQGDLEKKNVELNELQHSHCVVMNDLCSKSQNLQIFVDRMNALKEENVLLRKELRHSQKILHEAYNRSSLSTLNCVDSVDAMMGDKLFADGFLLLDKMLREMHEGKERMSKFIEEFDYLGCQAKELVSENVTLQIELSRKDDILKGLLFDLSLLQESASNTKDQKDEIEALEDELAVKSGELEQAVTYGQMLETQLQEKIDIISDLHLHISKEHELKAEIEQALAAKSSFEEELKERNKMAESLEMRLSEMENALSHMNDTNESLRGNMNEIESERDQFHEEVISLEEKLRKMEFDVREKEALTMEALQMAESRKIHAEAKEAEVKLLERSVEELECTINVLENKVDIIKGEAERQRLQREELELELNAVKQQMQSIRNADSDMKRLLHEKEKDLQEALEQIIILEKNIADKDAEIAQCKTHLSELNLHAEAQANEYKQKFRALEAMAQQVKPECHHISSNSSNNSEKNAVKSRGSSSPFKSRGSSSPFKSRGSGSPFKCIGLGLAQQMKSEKDEDLSAARMRIEELESLAVSRQKEIFALNARLAAAESMTHDVIRDLLGVKFDMNKYVSLLNSQKVPKMIEEVALNSLESQVKEEEFVKLKQQLNEFIEERQGWLEEIDRKQAELVAAQVALEKLRQRDQLFKTENEVLKMENVNYKKKAMELEEEVKKLSGQQNLQQRIHHHAKIKEENNMLKIQNEDLGARLRRTEVILSHVREELTNYRASIGKNPDIDFDGEQQLKYKLKEAEDDRIQLAQRLLSLCTSILKVAGITKPVSEISPDDAEEALDHVKNKLTSLERELQNLTLKSRTTSERNRLSGLMPQSPPRSSRTEENCQSPRRSSQTPFLSTLDR
ncbi:hypothetical protein SLE2022_202120 [Rubroshorea leprosula]